MTRATRILDSGTECNVENTLKKEIQPISTTGVENTIESSLFTKEESHIKDFRSNNNDDSHAQTQHTETETNSCDNTILTEDQYEKEKCLIERRNSNTSSDYEKISITDYKAPTHDLEPADEMVPESIAHIYKIENNSPVSPKVTKSRSVNDLARETTHENPLVGYLKQDLETESITSEENDDASLRYKKKKRRFTRNVLHYVPRHLVKQPKKKKKLKKKLNLSSSLNSLRLKTESFPRTAPNSYAKTRSLSRDELRSVIISSPTNFVHVASATNPNLVQNPVGFDLEQIVITHQQICATLPLLVRKDERGKSGNVEQERKDALEKQHSYEEANLLVSTRPCLCNSSSSSQIRTKLY